MRPIPAAVQMMQTPAPRVAPAVIATPMAERGFLKNPASMPKVIARHPMGRIGQPEEVANAVIWLCSEESSFVTGHALTVDGGWVAQ